MKSAMTLGLVWALVLGANAEANENLDGTWWLSAGESGGEALSQDQLEGGKLVIDGDHYEVVLHDVGTLTGVQVYDPVKKTIDITADAGPNKGRTCLGIYSLEGDEYHVAFAQPGEPRPTDMTTSPGSGNWVHVWKRSKE